MEKSLDRKLAALRANPHTCREFILADAKDADMAWGAQSPGQPHPPEPGGRHYNMPEFRQQMRELIDQGLLDVMLASVSTMDVLAHEEKRFADSAITPAIRANDTTDIWCGRGMKYRDRASRPFATCYLEEAMYGSLRAEKTSEPAVNLGLYSVTFNGDLDTDHEVLSTFRDFRAEAEMFGFRYFLEVFAPNLDLGMTADETAAFVNDHICRMLAAVPRSGRPEFLKIPFLGPRWLEELVAYDPSVIVGILGGSSGTTHDAFKLIEEGKKYGARVALFGRKIKDAEHALTFVSFLRRVADEEIKAGEAVRAYHTELAKLKIPPKRDLEDDLQLTTAEMSYAR